MSIEMLRFARLVRTRFTFGNVDFPTIVTPLLPPSNHRVAVRLHDSHDGTTVKFGVTIGGTSFGLGRRIDDNKTLFFNFLEHGSLPTFAFVLMPDPLQESNFTTTEWFSTEEFLRESVERYRSDYLQ